MNMARRNSNTNTKATPAQPQTIAASGPSKAAGTLSVAMELPIVAEGDGYQTRRIDVQLNARQAMGFRRLYDGLHETGARLQNGRYVQMPPDAIRFLLEHLADAFDAS